MEKESEFKHSIKVPVQYKKAAKILKSSMEGGASIKGQIFAEKHAVNTHIILCIYKYRIMNLFYNFFIENKSIVCANNKNFK